MKEKIKNALLRLKEALGSDASADEIPCERKLVNRFDAWVNSRGYCKTDESIQELSGRLGMSRFELSWVSRKIYGDNFTSLRKRLRVTEAARLLLEDRNIPISLIAEKVGIPDRTNFRRQFVEVFGMTPQEWRDRHRKL